MADTSRGFRAVFYGAGSPTITGFFLMSIKEKFESHPVVWGLTLIVVGFSSGFAAKSYLPFVSGGEVLPSARNCKVDGLDRLEEGHNIRITSLQNELVKLEANASDQTIVSYYQDKYKESADRIRTDIAAENSNYQAAIKQLVVKCE